eukprot:9476042-Pyramimonas_sp.AAC.1
MTLVVVVVLIHKPPATYTRTAPRSTRNPLRDPSRDPPATHLEPIHFALTKKIGACGGLIVQ